MTNVTLAAVRRGEHHPYPVVQHMKVCRSEWRICNTWLITAKSFPRGRINVVLVNEDLGF